MAEATIDRGDEQLVFTPPGPGSWSLDKTHVSRPPTRLHLETVPEPFERAFARMFERFGIPAAGNEQALVSGFVYSRIVPLAGDRFEERAAAADEAVATRRWRRDLERWDAEVKPASIGRHLELAAVDPDGLDDGALAAHLRTCADHVRAMIAQHHEFNGATMIPLGDFLAHATQWTGLPAHVLLELFAGASPTSTGECPELDEVRRALADDPPARRVLDRGDDPAEVLRTLRAEASPATAAAISTWVDLVGHRILDGFDVDQPCAIEKPAVLVSCLRRALEARGAVDVSERLAEVMARVPDEHRADFDELYRDAFELYRLRDERGIYSDAGAFGLMRRSMLAAGRRLAAQGRLADAGLAVEAAVDELVALLAGADGPSAGELAGRRRARYRWSVADAPSELGEPASPPPPFDHLPPAMGRMTRAIVTFTTNMSRPPEPIGVATSLSGLPASPGIHEGTARIVRSVDDLDQVGPGDVIVAITTGESFNLALSLASAVVTDHGGLLSHAAILAREYGIPAVVGTEQATARIPAGAAVRVDGSTGEVTW